MPEEAPIRLGLIGDNIADSRAPRLHEIGGRLLGRSVSYERLVPSSIGLPFEAVFDQARAEGYRGLNITHPYKERVVPLVTIPDLRVRRIGACNTVTFDADGATGHNTDWSGFRSAYVRTFGGDPPGIVCIIGAGGAGRAIAFALVELGVSGIRLVDRDIAKAEALATALRAADEVLDVSVVADGPNGAEGATGLVNCTPVGMVGHEGTPLPRRHMKSAAWAFDAVYTPSVTEFLADAAATGLAIIPGYELYFFQGLHAVEIFNGVAVDEQALRLALESDI